MIKRPPQKRAFSGLVGRNIPGDVVVVEKLEPAGYENVSNAEPIAMTPAAAPTTVHSKLSVKKSKPNSKSKSLRIQYGLTPRNIVSFLKRPEIGDYQRPTTPDASKIPKRRMNAIIKHERGECSCEELNRDCARYKQKLFNEAMNNMRGGFEPLFLPQEIQTYLTYARGGKESKGLGELEDYLVNIENRVINRALSLGPSALKPLKHLDRRIASIESALDDSESAVISSIVRSQKQEDENARSPVRASDVNGIDGINVKVDVRGEIVPEEEDDEGQLIAGQKYEETSDDESIEPVDLTQSGHVVTEGRRQKGGVWLQKPLKKFDKPIPHGGKDDPAAKWLREEIARLEQQASTDASKSKILRCAEEALERIFLGVGRTLNRAEK
jgi:hypothetical protein